MNEIEDVLHDAVAERSSRAVAEVATRVARRRRRRRTGAGAVVVVAALVVVGIVVDRDGDTPPDLSVVEDPDGTVVDPPDPDDATPLDDPVGADGARGTLDDIHVEATDLRGLVDCADHADAGWPDDAGIAAGESVIEALRAAGLHDQPFVTSSSGGQSLEGVPAVGLSRRYGPTLDFIADHVDTDRFCVDLPRVGAYNEPPDLAPITVTPVDAPAPEDGRVEVVIGDGCVPKAVWQATVVRELADRVAIGHLLGTSDGLIWPADCEIPVPMTVAVPPGSLVVVATSPATMTFGPVARGGTGAFTFDPANLVGDPATMGDDLIAQNLDDPSIRFQVSDVFGEVAVSSTTRPVFTDQWPVVGEGRIEVPSTVPAGFYQVHFIHHPEINGVLGVVPSEDGIALPEPGWGWRIPDVDGDGRGDVISGPTGHVLLAVDDGYVELIGDSGGAVGVPLEGDRVFTCNPDGRLLQQWHEPAGDGVAVRLAGLTLENGEGVWLPEPSFFFGEPGPALPARGQGCERFGTPPADVPVADGAVSDIHVEATDMVFPECGNPFTAAPLSPDRDAELTAIYDSLVADGLLDPLAYFSTSMGRGPDGIMIGLYRRYGPTVEWLAERVDVGDLCFLPPPLLPPVGAFTGAPGLLDWRIDGEPPGPDDTSFRVVNAGRCGLVYPDEQLLPAQVAEFDDRVEIGLPLRPRFGPSVSPCFAPDVFEIELGAPLGDREIVAASSPETMRFSPDMTPIPTDTPITVVFDPAGLGDETTMGDDMMIQNVDDPSIQIQVSGVFTGDPTAGPPAPIVTDRWTPTGTASLLIPAGTPPGEYTYLFIEHPQFNGSFTLGG